MSIHKVNTEMKCLTCEPILSRRDSEDSGNQNLVLVVVDDQPLLQTRWIKEKLAQTSETAKMSHLSVVPNFHWTIGDKATVGTEVEEGMNSKVARLDWILVALRKLWRGSVQRRDLRQVGDGLRARPE